jgi:hypothetical protein
VRGTTFTVDVVLEDAVPVATVTTAEGTVVHSAPDPQVPSKLLSERVTAGTAERIKKGEKPAPIVLTPEPQRKTTVEVGATSSLVVDPLGRTNGFTRDGKRVIQTPGAQVKRDGDRIVIVLPDLPDGNVVARVDKKANDQSDNGDVNVQTTIEERGKAPVKLEGPKKAVEAPKVTDKVQEPPKSPRLLPTLPATPKPTENKSNGNIGNNKSNGSGAAPTDRTASGQSSGNDPKRDNGK